MKKTKKERGDTNPNGLFFMDHSTWDSIVQDLTEIKEKLDLVSMKKDFSLFNHAHFSIAAHNGEMITDASSAEEYFRRRTNLKIMITDISFRPILNEESSDINSERKIKESPDFLITVHFGFMDKGSLLTGAGIFSRRHIDVCVMNP